MKTLVVALAATFTILTIDAFGVGEVGRIGTGSRGRPHIDLEPPANPWHGGLLLVYFIEDWTN